jgi:hypothetical protein
MLNNESPARTADEQRTKADFIPSASDSSKPTVAGSFKVQSRRNFSSCPNTVKQ